MDTAVILKLLCKLNYNLISAAKERAATDAHLVSASRDLAEAKTSPQLYQRVLRKYLKALRTVQMCDLA